MTVVLRPAEEFREQAAAILTAERARLRAHGISGELVHVGGTSVPGALTRGDVDLHLRVPSTAFAATVSSVARVHAVTKPEIWCATLATFDVAAALPTGLAVTPVDSEHDLRFTRTWSLIAAHPALLTLYNDAKLQAGSDDYETRKSEVIDYVLTLWPDGIPRPERGLS